MHTYKDNELFWETFLRAECEEYVQYLCSMVRSEVHSFLINRISTLYDEGEASAIALLLGERIAGGREAYKTYRHDHRTLEDGSFQLMESLLRRVLANEPVQYVLQEAWFYGLKFIVNEHVLIPRRETEELTHWVVEDLRTSATRLAEHAVMDVCTGSGCIGLSIKHALPGLKVAGCDLSEEALQVARQNAGIHRLEVSFFSFDVLTGTSLPYAPYTVMVSNPPYISQSEAGSLPANVIEYEPALALFAYGDDPLVFYRRLASLGTHSLQKGGRMYVEMHESRSGEVRQVFEETGYGEINIRKDMQGKERLLRAALL